MQAFTINAFQPGILDLGEVAGDVPPSGIKHPLLPFLVQVEGLNGHTSLVELFLVILIRLLSTCKR